MKLNLALILVLFVNLFSGCAGFVKSDVSVFHTLPENKRIVTYVFFALKNQESSLEYKAYQDLIRQELEKHNFVEISQTVIPDIIVVFSYGIDSGKEKLVSIPLFGQTGVSSSYTFGTLNTYGNYGTYSGTTTYRPSYGVVGSSTVSRTKYSRGLWLFMIDSKSVGKEKLSYIYEGSVKSSGSSSQLPKVMPAMIKALFEEFPGKSGSTRRETGLTQ